MDISSSTGSGGRPWQAISWVVTKSTGGDVTTLHQYLVQYFVSTVGQLMIPRSLFAVGTYSFTVTLTNFLGGSTAQSSSVTVSGDRNQPAVSILGSGYQTMVSSASLKLVGTATLSSCAAASSTLSYTWSIYNATGRVTPISTIRSISSDPTRYTLSPYTLSVGNTYIVTLQVQSLMGSKVLAAATTSTSVFIASGVITAVVKGSSGSATRQVSASSTLVLDASTSTDDNAPLGQAKLNYHWNCIIASGQNFSLPCNLPPTCSSTSIPSATTSTTSGFPLGLPINTTLLALPANCLYAGTQYNFVVTVTSTDGFRSASKSVYINAISPGMPIVAIPTKITTINADRALAITGLFSAPFAVTASWDISCDGSIITSSLDSSALTPLTNTFTATQAINPSTTFPIALSANTLVAGRTYAFRLSVTSSTSSTVSSYAEISLSVNAPPSGGQIVVTPSSGTALTTIFTGDTRITHIPYHHIPGSLTYPIITYQDHSHTLYQLTITFFSFT